MWVCAQKTTVNVTSCIYRNFAEIIEATTERKSTLRRVKNSQVKYIIAEQTNKQARVLDL